MAMFSFGILELLIIGVFGLACVGIPLIVVVSLIANRKQRQVQVTECPKCGKVAPPSNFCPHCGAKSIEASRSNND